MKIFLASALLFFSVWACAQDDLGPQGPAVKMAPAPVVTAVQGKPATVPLIVPRRQRISHQFQ